MSDASRYRRMYPPARDYRPPLIPREALEGVRTRRVLALCLDFILVALLSTLLWFALLIVSFGLSLFLLPPLFPLVAFFYNGLTVSGWRMATPGMRVMDLEMRLMNGHQRRRSRRAVLRDLAVPAALPRIADHERQALPP